MGGLAIMLSYIYYVFYIISPFLFSFLTGYGFVVSILRGEVVISIVFAILILLIRWIIEYTRYTLAKLVLYVVENAKDDLNDEVYYGLITYFKNAIKNNIVNKEYYEL